MTDIAEAFFIIGSALTDSLEAWVVVLIGLVIVIDLIAGVRSKSFLVFGVLQVIYMIGGYAWAYWVAAQQDVSGPFAWALVVGLWCTVAVVFHILFATAKLMKIN